MRYLIALFFLAVAGVAQPVNPPTSMLKGTPPGGTGGPCNAPQNIGYLNGSGDIYTCKGGVWTLYSGGATSPLTTKGDVWGFSTTNARVPVGTNGTVLTADSTQALGVNWLPGTSSGTVLAYTGSHTLQPGDCGNWLTFNGSNLQLTLASPAISSTCSFSVQNLNTSTSLTISRNGLLINGVASDVTIGAQSGSAAGNQSCWTDGTNYFCSQGIAGAQGPQGPQGPPGSGGATADPPYVTISAATYGPIFSLTAPPSSGWTWVNQGSSTVTTVNTSLLFSFTAALATDSVRCYMRSLPASTNYTADIAMVTRAHGVGIAVSDGTKFVFAWDNGQGAMLGFNFNTSTSVGSQYFASVTTGSVTAPLLWLRVQDDGTNRKFFTCGDADTCYLLNSQSSHTSLTETQFGICYETNQTPAGTAKLVHVTSSTP